eukprot:424777_1
MNKYTLCVSYISKQSHENDIIKLFGRYGRIQSFNWVHNNEHYTKSCLIEYHSSSQAKAALKLDYYLVHNNRIKVEYAEMRNNHKPHRRDRSRSRQRHKIRARSCSCSRDECVHIPEKRDRYYNKQQRRNRKKYRGRDRSRTRSCSCRNRYECIHIHRYRSWSRSPTPPKRFTEKPTKTSTENKNVITEEKDNYYPEYAVNCAHVKRDIVEFIDIFNVENTLNSNTLLEIFNKMEVKPEDLNMWSLNNKQTAIQTLKTTIDYAEHNSKCSSDAKTKLRAITKLIIESEKQSDYLHILLLLSSHGSVCNVMKEVGINSGYGMMTNNLNTYIKSQTLENQILKCLRDLRVLLVEELFHTFKFYNNTHIIAGFHNHIAKQIGIKEYIDPNISPPNNGNNNWKHNLDKRFFKTMYTKQNIVKHIIKEINEKRIGFQKIVKYFEDNIPDNIDCKDKMEFLQLAIDIDTGKINEKYLCWLLVKMDIFMIKDNNWKVNATDANKNKHSQPPRLHI